MSKLKPCPLCGGPANIQKPLVGRGPPYNVYCGKKDEDWDDNECGLVLYGGNETRKQMIEKSNKRA